MAKFLPLWESNPDPSDAEIDEIPDFDARGMRRVYGRGDTFGRHNTYNMDIWIHRSGRLLMRCWSRCSEAENRSFEIKGITPSEIPEKDEREGFLDTWLPEVVRAAIHNRYRGSYLASLDLCEKEHG